MMIAKGILEKAETPYFYFQEYKKVKDPKGDVTAQLMEAFLIAQEKNKNDKPLYGCTVSGKYWEFMIMENRTYCISDSYDCTKPHELQQIIAILRKFGKYWKQDYVISKKSHFSLKMVFQKNKYNPSIKIIS